MSNIDTIKDFVTIGYRNYLKRYPDDKELDMYTNMIITGKLGRAEFLVSLIKCKEYKIPEIRKKMDEKEKNNITLLVPTRNRSLLLQRMFDSAISTAKYPNLIEMSVYVDNDDIETQEYLKTMKGNIKITIGERIIHSDMPNRAYEKGTSDIYMGCGDDIIFRSKNWDEIVMNTFKKYNDKIILVHGDCLERKFRGNFGTHIFLHSRWIDTLGYFSPPYFSALHADKWINDVANILGRRIFLPGVITEHIHWSTGKAKMCDYQEYMDRAERDDVNRLYRLLEYKRQIDIQKLKNVIKVNK